MTEQPKSSFYQEMVEWFPTGYTDAVRRFQAAIEPWQDQSETGRWDVPSRTETDLYTDHLYLAPLKSRKRLLVLMSGVHGPETYAGHAIQRMFLSEILPRVDRDHLGVFVVHALNPYGFKFNRRHTENGVNLNRNCSASPDLFKVKNMESIAMSDRFIPKSPLQSEISHLLQAKREDHGRIRFEDVDMDQFIKTVAPGQFSSPEGLEFGGFKAEPQVVALTWRLREILPGYRDIFFFDLHTGLGHRGRLHLLTGDASKGVHPELFNEWLKPEEDKAYYEFTPNNAEGFYPTFGSTNDLFAELATDDQRVCALTMEFGTLGHDLTAQLESLNIWLAEHQGQRYGYATKELKEKVERAHVEKSNPSDPLWRRQVIAAAQGLLTNALSRAGLFV